MKLRINTDKYDGNAMRLRERSKAYSAKFDPDRENSTVADQIRLQIDLMTRGDLGLHTRAVY